MQTNKKKRKEKKQNSSITLTSVKAELTMVNICQYIVQENLFRLLSISIEEAFNHQQVLRSCSLSLQKN